MKGVYFFYFFNSLVSALNFPIIDDTQRKAKTGVSIMLLLRMKMNILPLFRSAPFWIECVIYTHILNQYYHRYKSTHTQKKKWEWGAIYCMSLWATPKSGINKKIKWKPFLRVTISERAKREKKKIQFNDDNFSHLHTHKSGKQKKDVLPEDKYVNQLWAWVLVSTNLSSHKCMIPN